MRVDRVQPDSLHTGEWVRVFLKVCVRELYLFETAYLVCPSSRLCASFLANSTLSIYLPPPVGFPAEFAGRTNASAVIFWLIASGLPGLTRRLATASLQACTPRRPAVHCSMISAEGSLVDAVPQTTNDVLSDDVPAGIFFASSPTYPAAIILAPTQPNLVICPSLSR